MEPNPSTTNPRHLAAIVVALLFVGAAFLVNASSWDAIGQVSNPGGTVPGGTVSTQPSQSGSQASVFLGLTTIPGNAVYEVRYARGSREIIATRQGGSGEIVRFSLQRNIGYRKIGGVHAVAKLFEGGKFAAFWAYFPTGVTYPVTNFAATQREFKFTVSIPIGSVSVPFIVRIDRRTFAITASPQQSGWSGVPKLTGFYSAQDAEWIILAGPVAYSVRLNVVSGSADVPVPPVPVVVSSLTFPANAIVGAGNPL